jgi:haloalkane dehalogenase
VADLAFREAGDAGAPVALLLHGYPNSSYLWRDCLEPIAAAGWRAVAPDLPGFGDSAPFAGERGTWTDHVYALDDFVAKHDLAPVALVAHDWGALIGLRWACDRMYAVSALAIM